ncbi:uncharacterized protein LOC132747136 [Ruditapes philippinarum]|uniref:uncharacterized protein LOC132747136 n=1 Tax=Ruditapes philippinarum TaxID=129788 RepID=UPI00295B920D|nr:uncharacterized protein LOC132747136 [Ruditapes philippinarum]
MKLLLKCLVFLTIFKVISCSNEDNTRVILSHMQDWGKEIFKTLTGKNKGQYLVAALLSDDDLNTPHKMPGKLLKGCPNDGPDKDKHMIMCSTSGVLLNRKSEEILNRSRWNDTKYKDHPWHGEYILLNEGFIEKLVENFGKDKNCQVYLYSYYIPCADINGTPYSCSNEILIYNDRGDISCKITVIGYTKVFRRSNKTLTNKTIAVNNINSARAQLFQNVKNAKLMAIKDVKDRNRAVPLQELMFSCLVESHLSGCCVSSISYRRRSNEIIAYFVNNMVHSLVIKFCTKTAMELASGFGKPYNAQKLSQAGWTFNGEHWNLLYPISPEQLRNQMKLQCAKKPMSVDSICTKYDSDEYRRRQQENDMPLRRRGG